MMLFRRRHRRIHRVEAMVRWTGRAIAASPVKARDATSNAPVVDDFRFHDTLLAVCGASVPEDSDRSRSAALPVRGRAGYKLDISSSPGVKAVRK
jgi:hypothetical protein